jgi:hypothetical protein
MPLTKEEKRQRAKERDIARHLLGERFPSAVLSIYGGENKTNESRYLFVNLARGDAEALHIHWTGEWPSKRVEISIDDIDRLGKFIHALVCRYNALIEEPTQSQTLPAETSTINESPNS